MNKLFLILSLSIFIFSCNSTNKKTPNENKETKIKEETSTYSINTEDLKFEWTAYKTTKKLAVKGTFNAITIENDKKNVSIAELFKNTKFTIDLKSVNSGNEARDLIITNLFFGTFSNSKEIYGFIKDVNGNNNEGEIFVSLNINEHKNIVRMDYKTDETTVLFSGDLDLLNWKAEKSLESLHKACEDKHTGEDGVSKTWSEMHIEIAIPLIKD